MKKLILPFILALVSINAFADAEAIRRNNCFGFLSYRYKTSGYIYSLNPLSGKKEVLEFSETDRNCNPGASIWAYREASLFNLISATPHHATIVAASNPDQLFDNVFVTSSLIMDAGRKNQTFALHKEAKKVTLFESLKGKSTRYESKVKVGRSEFKDGKLTINNVELFLSNGLGENGTNIAQLLVYLDEDKELDENTEKLFELRLEFKKLNTSRVWRIGKSIFKNCK